MKNLCALALSLCAAAAVNAQALPGTPFTPDKSKLNVTGGANRATSAQLAASASGRVVAAGSSSSAPVFVDATGKTVGRSIDPHYLLLTLDGKSLLVYLNSDVVPGLSHSEFRSGGLTLSGIDNSVMYTGPGCTGTPYISFVQGAQQYGHAVREADESAFVYIGDASTVANGFSPASAFLNGQCYTTTGFWISAIEVTTVIPATAIATGVLWIR